MRPRRRLLLAAVLTASVLLIGRLVSGIYAEWTWYSALGALPVYLSALRHEAALRGVAFLAGFGLAFANLYTVRRSIVSVVLPRRLGNLDIGEAVPGSLLTLVVVALSLLTGAALAIPTDDWTVLAAARVGIPFGERDPYLDRDFGFYVYQLPLERALFLWSFLALMTVGLCVLLLYAITPSLRMEQGRVFVSSYVRRHLTVLGALALLLVSWSYRLESLELLSRGSGTGGVFDSLDHAVQLPLLTGLSVGAVGVALLFLFSGWMGQRRLALAALTALLIAGPVGRVVVPAYARSRTTTEERRIADRPYRATRTLFTRRAFALEEVVHADTAGLPLATRDDAMRGLSSWDAAVLARSGPGLAPETTVPIVAWHAGATGLTATVVARPTRDLPLWPVGRVDASVADERGLPLPPMGEGEPGLTTTPVVVAPGLIEPLVVDDTLRSLAAPGFSRTWDRIAHAWSLQRPRLLAVANEGTGTRIVRIRDVRERVAAVAPFFAAGPTVQALIAADTLYWTIELFSASEDYPLADSISVGGRPVRYLHRAATALVNAASGRVRLVAAPLPDPITRSWMRRFPSLFTSLGALSSSIGERWPPPVDLLAAQGAAVLRTGFAGDSVFPHHVAHSNETVLAGLGAAPTLFLQHGARGALARAEPLLDGDDLLAGTLVARGGDWPRVEWWPTASHPKWSNVLERLVSALGARARSARSGEPRRGEVQVVPTREGPLFTQSFYQWRDDGHPSLSGVATAMADGPVRVTAALEDQLDASASRERAPALRARVTALYEAMHTAMRRGDWPAFGRAFDELGRLLQRAPR